MLQLKQKEYEAYLLRNPNMVQKEKDESNESKGVKKNNSSNNKKKTKKHYQWWFTQTVIFEFTAII